MTVVALDPVGGEWVCGSSTHGESSKCGFKDVKVDV